MNSLVLPTPNATLRVTPWERGGLHISIVSGCQPPRSIFLLADEAVELALYLYTLAGDSR